MAPSALGLALLFSRIAGAGAPTPQETSPPSNPWKLVWSDEFDSPNGSSPNPKHWKIELGGKSWGNQELETYTNRAKNVSIQDGMLAIHALKENFTGIDGVAREYTSGRIKTQGRFSTTYGKIEARIKIPCGQGLWPAFWMLGDKAEWPQGGEIDIMENIGREPAMVHGTVHGPGYSGNKGISAPYSLPGGGRFADDFHIFAVEWQPNEIKFLVDGISYATVTPANLPAGAHWVYDHPFFIILNVAVGGSWPGNPDATTTFPQTMLVDYVRVYEKPH
jgi:beta-glucanase (GH16 family)